MRQLNLGCGRDIRSGWVNLDSAPIPGVDVVHDVQKLPLPFQDDSFDFILCRDILEHVEYLPVLRDLYRILAPGGILEIQVPHFTSRWSYMDPTHRRYFSVRTFNFFIRDSFNRRDYYFDFHFNRLTLSRITFEKGLYFYNYLVEKFINLSPGLQDFYEATLFSRLFPAGNIIVKLQK